MLITLNYWQGSYKIVILKKISQPFFIGRTLKNPLVSARKIKMAR